MSFVYETRPQTTQTTVQEIEFPQLVPIDSESLAAGFRSYNQGIRIPLEYQERVDDILDREAREIAPELADHGRRVGGYAGAILMNLDHPLYSDTFHEGIVRTCGAVHDIGKEKTRREVLYSSLGRTEFGSFNWDQDREYIEPHPVDGYIMLTEDPEALPPEARYAAGCHHWISPNREPYGLPMSIIDRENSKNLGLVDWAHFMLRVVAMADRYDAATSRINNFFDSEGEKGKYVASQAHKLFPGQEAQVITALRTEQTHYLI